MKDIIWKIKSFEELSIHELYEILKVRQEVFVVEQTCYYLDADGYDQKALHLFAENSTINASSKFLTPVCFLSQEQNDKKRHPVFGASFV